MPVAPDTSALREKEVLGEDEHLSPLKQIVELFSAAAFSRGSDCGRFSN